MEPICFDIPLVCCTESAALAIAQAAPTNYARMGLSRRTDGGLGVQLGLADGDTPSGLSISERVVGADDSIALKLAPSGGAAIHLRTSPHG